MPSITIKEGCSFSFSLGKNCMSTPSPINTFIAAWISVQAWNLTDKSFFICFINTWLVYSQHVPGEILCNKSWSCQNWPKRQVSYWDTLNCLLTSITASVTVLKLATDDQNCWHYQLSIANHSNMLALKSFKIAISLASLLLSVTVPKHQLYCSAYQTYRQKLDKNLDINVNWLSWFKIKKGSWC